MKAEPTMFVGAALLRQDESGLAGSALDAEQPVFAYIALCLSHIE